MVNRSTGNDLPTHRVRRGLLGLAAALLSAAGLLIVSPASPALAAKPSPSVTAPVTFTVTAQAPSPSGPAKTGAMQAMETIIITCVTQENYPHNSSHVNGVVNVTGTTTCDYPVTTIDLVQNLYFNGRKWAYGYTYQTPGGIYAMANAATPCQNGNYQGVMQYWIYFGPTAVPTTADGQVASPVIPITC